MKLKNKFFAGMLGFAILASAIDSQACSRCSFFGSSCRYASHPTTRTSSYREDRATAVFSQTYIFNNTEPSQIGGETVFGYPDQSQPAQQRLNVSSLGSRSPGLEDLLLAKRRQQENDRLFDEMIDRIHSRDHEERKTALAAQALLAVRNAESSAPQRNAINQDYGQPSQSLQQPRQDRFSDAGQMIPPQLRTQQAGVERVQIVRQTIYGDGSIRTERIKGDQQTQLQRSSPPNPFESRQAPAAQQTPHCDIDPYRTNAAKAPQMGMQAASSVLRSQCASCHGSHLDSPAAGLRIDSGIYIDPETANAIRESVRRADHPKGSRMPKNKPALTSRMLEQLDSELLNAMLQRGQSQFQQKKGW